MAILVEPSISIVHLNNKWLLLRGDFKGEYDTFREVLDALQRAKEFEGWA